MDHDAQDWAVSKRSEVHEKVAGKWILQRSILGTSPNIPKWVRDIMLAS